MTEHNTENIHALIEQCGLGTIEEEIIPVSGGFMHKIYKVHTTAGTYAVKCLNPEIMSRPGVTENYAGAERLEQILEDNGLPVVAALSFDNKKMITVNGRYYYIFPWLEGKITDFNEISKEQCFTAGSLLGRIHRIDAHNTDAEEPELSEVDFAALLDIAEKKESVITSVLEENIALLENAQKSLNEARKKLPSMSAICDDDMDPKNVMWHEGKAYIIDLECLEYGNPISSALNLALQWCGTVTGNFNKDNLEEFFKGYLQSYDNGFRSYDELFGIAYTWIEWLEYNIKRALGMVSSDPEEIKLGETETLNTIDRIKYLASIEGDICSILRNMPEVWDVYTIDRKRTGKKCLRGEQDSLSDDEFHLWIMVWIKNPETGKYLVSQRVADKEVDPLKWETVAGHSISGETSVEAAVREVYEEVGLKFRPEDAKVLVTKVATAYDGCRYNYIRDSFYFETTEEPDLSKATTKEVLQTKWLSFPEIREMYERGECCLNMGDIYGFELNPVPADRYRDIIGQIVKGVIDRPLGSSHPRKKNLYYPVNYGFVSGVIGGDGAEQDIYLLGETSPVSEFTGKVIAVYHRYDDNETKWIVLPCDENGNIREDIEIPSDDEIYAQIAFQEQFYYGVQVRR